MNMCIYIYIIYIYISSIYHLYIIYVSSIYHLYIIYISSVYIYIERERYIYIFIYMYIYLRIYLWIYLWIYDVWFSIPWPMRLGILRLKLTILWPLRLGVSQYMAVWISHVCTRNESKQKIQIAASELVRDVLQRRDGFSNGRWMWKRMIKLMRHEISAPYFQINPCCEYCYSCQVLIAISSSSRNLEFMTCWSYVGISSWRFSQLYDSKLQQSVLDQTFCS